MEPIEHHPRSASCCRCCSCCLLPASFSPQLARSKNRHTYLRTYAPYHHMHSLSVSQFVGLPILHLLSYIIVWTYLYTYTYTYIIATSKEWTPKKSWWYVVHAYRQIMMFVFAQIFPKMRKVKRYDDKSVSQSVSQSFVQASQVGSQSAICSLNITALQATAHRTYNGNTALAGLANDQKLPTNKLPSLWTGCPNLLDANCLPFLNQNGEVGLCC